MKKHRRRRIVVAAISPKSVSLSLQSIEMFTRNLTRNNVGLKARREAITEKREREVRCGGEQDPLDASIISTDLGSTALAGMHSQ